MITHQDHMTTNNVHLNYTFANFHAGPMAFKHCLAVFVSERSVSCSTHRLLDSITAFANQHSIEEEMGYDTDNTIRPIYATTLSCNFGLTPQNNEALVFV